MSQGIWRDADQWWGYDVKTPVGDDDGTQALLVMMMQPSHELGPYRARSSVKRAEPPDHRLFVLQHPMFEIGFTKNA